ncbi:class I SAM-dependent methyltransferase [uncultured Pseudokineococcus sp.]|uniref:class I SAM-dependent methyltransferase n=1 Tax=uncultured Pseudokineococcus sp. TaxID=1642928 RepID=UPI002631C2B2|nr:class I SAM-dependent methyltransferase [uncultured Pseudokineococcus sp.]
MPADAVAGAARGAAPAGPGQTGAPPSGGASPRAERRGARPSAPRVLVDGVADLLAGASGAPRAHGALRVLDLGGGTGGLAVRLAAGGHDVVVVDPSPDALAALARRADEEGVADRLTGVQGDAEDLPDHVADASVDLLLAHGVLEVVDDPARALLACRRALRPTGRLSVLVAGRGGAVLARVASGHLRQARALQVDPDGRWGPQDPLRRRFDARGAEHLLAEAGFSVLRTEGVGVLSPLVPRSGPAVDPAAAQALEDLERAAGADPALLGVAGSLHLHAAPV